MTTVTDRNNLKGGRHGRGCLSWTGRHAKGLICHGGGACRGSQSLMEGGHAEGVRHGGGDTQRVSVRHWRGRHVEGLCLSWGGKHAEGLCLSWGGGMQRVSVSSSRRGQSCSHRRGPGSKREEDQKIESDRTRGPSPRGLL